MKILGKWPGWPQGPGSLSGTRPAKMTSRRASAGRPGGYRGKPGEYESPQIIVIGNVRDLTTGSSSSGTKDANSQYYW